MKQIKDIEWFKQVIAPTIKGYEIKYRFYENGDFGPLNQVILDSPKKSGGIDFWGLGWLGVDLFDYERDEQLINILLTPNQKQEQDDALKHLQELL